jgi:deazaflavin-dependent oxidoreductase (nitroreductase family)
MALESRKKEGTIMSTSSGGTSAGPDPTQVVDSPSGFVADHIRTYLESDGEQGHEWRNGVPTLLLTVLGRKSGVWRRTALIYGRDGENYVVVASKGGAEQHPMWWLNLREHPEAEIQVGPEKLSVVAHEAEGEERARLWDAMAEIWPDYNDYQTKTDRRIPIVVLAPVR